MEQIYSLLSEIVDEKNIQRDELLKKHTTFRIGGPADYFVAPANEDQAAKCIKVLNENNIKYYVLGNGSNVLAADEGYRGVILYIGEKLSDITVLDECTIMAGAGAMLSKVAKVAYDNSMAGMEFASGIPGSVGGAIVMNAGAYGGEIKDILVKAIVCDKEGKIFELSNDDLELSYRHSIIQEEDYVVLKAVFTLKKGNQEEIKALMQDLNGKRREKQPLEFPSAGSTFKRPEGDFAGRLIMEAGFRGYAVGGAMVSEKHCGFVVNNNEATAEDVKALMDKIIEDVETKFGVRLEPEVKIL